jgi:dihydropteroate synthase|tara:strand:- start:47 stop:892 length:846 start_codon:yes stop_codon:yes gene_type:complete
MKTTATFQLTSQGKTWDLVTPQVMGIVNCTPDSFFAGNRFEATDVAINKGIEMLHHGANAIDIGGQSTRPGAAEVSADDEWQRIRLVIKGILEANPDAILSVDTFHGEVARRALESGVFMINDVYAGQKDEGVVDAVRSFDAPLVMMHMQGTPDNMQNSPQYTDASAEILAWLAHRMKTLQEKGARQLVLDPGFGFGKTLEHNFQILKSFETFKKLDLPILAGVSRKSMIWKTLKNSPEESLNGTTALHAWALNGGANILRAHDVKEALETTLLFNQMHVT